MKPHTILLAVEDEFDSKVIRGHLEADYDVECCPPHAPDALRLFCERRPAVLLLGFTNTADAQVFYLNLLRNAPDADGREHRVLLFCHHRDDSKAADLCLRGAFDDYVIVKPWLDVQRLRVAMKRATGSLQDTQTIMGLRQQLSQVRLSHAHLLQLETDLTSARSELAAGLGDSQAEMYGWLQERGASVAKDVEARFPRLGLRTLLEERYDSHLREALERQGRTLSGLFDRPIEQLAAGVANVARNLPLQPLRRTVLVVDDDEFIFDLIAHILADESWLVIYAGTPDEARLQLNRQVPDLVLMDVMLPGVDGIDLTKEMRGSPRTAQVPIIMLTGRSERSIVEASIRAGAQDFLVKPPERESLLLKVQQFFAASDRTVSGGRSAAI